MKIKEEKLNQIKELRKEIGELSMQIASAEIQKHNAMHRLSAIQNGLNGINAELEKEYGAEAMINLQTGEVSYPD
jgi:chromosome segregation ATPase